ncbi:pyridoxal phosphate-dependent aminotransferase [Patescibacteria group bacterium]|nr:pyridoxal phosphate-dependent aminotransferase [Patescibacteria group bacterium]
MNEIEKGKKIFNIFFKKDLYGRFDDDNNIILSRGGWEDSYVSFPKLFRFCINYTLQKHWTGYSDSLGHKNTLRALKLLVNYKYGYSYQVDNLALTIGNVITIGFVARLLKDKLGDVPILTFKPYYPPILKSINYYFNNIRFISNLEDENVILQNIRKNINENNIKVLFLSNAIGVEGRTFSEKFWIEVIKFVKAKNDLFLVIDEGLWFEPLNYPVSINDKRIIRVISLSKKYGLAGCKLGFMIGEPDFIKEFYDYASTNYGGPLSVFFLLAEFIYQFEYAYYSQNKDSALKILATEYDISAERLNTLFDDFIKTIQKNRKKVDANQKILNEWIQKNNILIEKTFNFGGINVFIKFKNTIKAYDLFNKFIEKKVSVMPSSCLGDENDSMIRITLLEKSNILRRGLKIIENNL